MPADPIAVAGGRVDLSRRLQASVTVAASPSGSAETTICTLTIPDSLVVVTGVFIEASAAWTVGTSGTGSTLRVRQTNTGGTTIVSSGLIATAAASLQNMAVQGVDTAAVLPGQVYVLTLTVAAGAATSTVSAASIFVTIV